MNKFKYSCKKLYLRIQLFLTSVSLYLQLSVFTGKSTLTEISMGLYNNNETTSEQRDQILSKVRKKI